MEMLSRSPNQYGPKSVWRMRLDVIRGSGQIALPLVQGVEDQAAGEHAVEEQTAEEQTEAKEVEVRASAEPGEIDSAVQDADDLIDVDAEVVVAAKLVRAMQAEIGSLRREVKTLDNTVRELLDANQGGLQGNRAARRKEARRGRRRRGDAKTEEDRAGPVVSVLSELVGAVNGLLEDFELQPLTEHETRRVLRMEADWHRRFPEQELPCHFALYAAEQAAKKSEKDFTTYMLRVLEDSLTRGYTERGIPSEQSKQRFMKKQGRWKSRY